MRIESKRINMSAVVWILFSICICGCVKLHKPNAPYSEQVPHAIANMSVRNEEFSKEILKLPDIMDGISEAEKKALTRFSISYLKQPEMFNQAFKHISRSGREDVRPYNSVVEALFWIYLKGKHIQQAVYIIEDYRHKKLNSMARRYSGLDAEGLFNLSWDIDDKARWGDFDDVKKRLNSPEAISYFTSRYLSYDYYLGGIYSNAWVYKRKRSNCVDTSEFIVSLLKAGGYPARTVRVASPRGYGSHIIVSYTDEDKTYIIDDGRTGPKGILGPYNKLHDSDYIIE